MFRTIFCLLLWPFTGMAGELPDFVKNTQNEISKVAGYDIELKLADKPTAPEGRVVFISPIELQQLHSYAELKAHLAHLAAHVSLHHSGTQKQDIVERRPYKAEEYVLGLAIGTAGALVSGHDEINHYQRQPGYKEPTEQEPIRPRVKVIRARDTNLGRELDADEQTLKILKQAGGCPSAYLDFLRRQYEKSANRPDKSHFATAAGDWQRLQTLENHLKEEKCPSSPKDALFEKFKLSFASRQAGPPDPR